MLLTLRREGRLGAGDLWPWRSVGGAVSRVAPSSESSAGSPGRYEYQTIGSRIWTDDDVLRVKKTIRSAKNDDGMTILEGPWESCGASMRDAKPELARFVSSSAIDQYSLTTGGWSRKQASCTDQPQQAHYHLKHARRKLRLAQDIVHREMRHWYIRRRNSLGDLVMFL